MSILTYSPSEVKVSIGALYAIEGFADGTFISVSKDEQDLRYMKAMDGNLARVLIKDDTYNITITLAQTSQANDVFNLLHKVDRVLGVGKFPLLIRDTQGTSRLFASNCWIDKVPDFSFSTNIEPRNWVLKASFADVVLGGNDQGDLAEIAGLSSTVLSVLDIVGG